MQVKFNGELIVEETDFNLMRTVVTGDDVQLLLIAGPSESGALQITLYNTSMPVDSKQVCLSCSVNEFSKPLQMIVGYCDLVVPA